MERIFLILSLLTSGAVSNGQGWKSMAAPKEGKVWVQPAQGEPAQPVWGHIHGIQIGLAPLPGPRGLIRIYTPYLGQQDYQVMNFIAMEPIVKDRPLRGFSELEMSALDGVRGKRFWSANDSLHGQPADVRFPAPGVIEIKGGKETLSLFIFSERFESGAQPYVRIRFFEERPFEFEITTYAQPGSERLDQLIVTATMGNFARLRELHLKNQVVSSLDLWPSYRDDAFTEHARFSSQRFQPGGDGSLYFIATPDEEDPTGAEYATSTRYNWIYKGRKAVQYWKISAAAENIEGLVNGRFTYWGGKAPIPGGISYENFELKLPFVQGAKMTFGISPLSVEDFLRSIRESH